MTSVPETPDRYGAYPRLTQEQVDDLVQRGERLHVEPGETLFREGDRGYDFFVVLDGRIATVEGIGDKEWTIGVHGQRRFLGEVSLLTGQAAPYSAVARTPAEVLRLTTDELRDIVSCDAALGDLILRAFLVRRSILIGLGAGYMIVGSRFSPEARRLREVAARNRLPYRWIDTEEDATAEALLRALNVAPEETPVVVLGEDRVLRNPTVREFAHAVGLPVPSASEAVADLLVVGAGPGGLAAAVYGAAEGLYTIAVDAVATGGQAGTSSRIENYLGFPAGISGGELADRATIQAQRLGAHLTVPAEAVGFEADGDRHVIRLADGGAITADTVVLATGARYRKLPIDRLADFEGACVFYAATVSEARQCERHPVAVVGGGNSAGQATVFLADHAERVRLVVREDDLSKTMSRYLIDRIERHPRVEIMLNSEVRDVIGDDLLEALVVEDNRTGERRQIEARELFVFIGAEPCTSWLQGQIALDDHGFVLTGNDALPDGSATSNGGRRPLLETSRPGVFAVGDVRSGSIKRVASAVGEGSMAVRLIFEHLEQRNGRQPAGQT